MLLVTNAAFIWYTNVLYIMWYIYYYKFIIIFFFLSFVYFKMSFIPDGALLQHDYYSL